VTEQLNTQAKWECNRELKRGTCANTLTVPSAGFFSFFELAIAKLQLPKFEDERCEKNGSFACAMLQLLQWLQIAAPLQQTNTHALFYARYIRRRCVKTLKHTGKVRIFNNDFVRQKLSDNIFWPISCCNDD
jgi:hypothetical protein